MCSSVPATRLSSLLARPRASLETPSTSSEPGAFPSLPSPPGAGHAKSQHTSSTIGSSSSKKQHPSCSRNSSFPLPLGRSKYGLSEKGGQWNPYPCSLHRFPTFSTSGVLSGTKASMCSRRGPICSCTAVSTVTEPLAVASTIPSFCFTMKSSRWRSPAAARSKGQPVSINQLLFMLPVTFLVGTTELHTASLLFPLPTAAHVGFLGTSSH